jgi:hypothetical protein
MHFDMKNNLKSNHNHTHKHAINCFVIKILQNKLKKCTSIYFDQDLEVVNDLKPRSWFLGFKINYLPSLKKYIKIRKQ